MAGSGTQHLRGAGQDIVLSLEHLVRTYPSRQGRHVAALSDVSVDVASGETLGVVGESGCGKSTLAKAAMMLPRPTSGQVRFEGRALNDMDADATRLLRRRMQMVFQDPVSSLNPRQTVRRIVEMPLVVQDVGLPQERRERVERALLAVGLDPARVGERRPHELSGGQCQRVSLARSLVLEPRLLICDEPVSALDVSVQAQVINLLEDAKAEYGLTMLFISHDLAVVKSISDRVMVMYLGKVCEVAPVEAIYREPRHPYTALLLASVARPDPGIPRARSLSSARETPSPLDVPSGCRFRTRCERATDRCTQEEPVIRAAAREGHYFACHHPA